MALVSLDGSFCVPIGPPLITVAASTPATTTVTLDAANEAGIYIGRIIWADGGSHTVDTSGSSSIAWRTGAATFSNAGTTAKVGLAAVDTGAGPPGRPRCTV